MRCNIVKNNNSTVRATNNTKATDNGYWRVSYKATDANGKEHKVLEVYSEQAMLNMMWDALPSIFKAE